MREYPRAVLECWPDCAVTGCGFKASVRLNSIYCYHCTTKQDEYDSAPDNHFNELQSAQRRFL